MPMTSKLAQVIKHRCYRSSGTALRYALWPNFATMDARRQIGSCVRRRKRACGRWLRLLTRHLKWGYYGPTQRKWWAKLEEMCSMRLRPYAHDNQLPFQFLVRFSYITTLENVLEAGFILGRNKTTNMHFEKRKKEFRFLIELFGVYFWKMISCHGWYG